MCKDSPVKGLLRLWGSLEGVLGFSRKCVNCWGFSKRCAGVFQGVCKGSPEGVLELPMGCTGVLGGGGVCWKFLRSLQGLRQGFLGSPRGMLGFPTGGMGCADLAIEGE